MIEYASWKNKEEGSSPSWWWVLDYHPAREVFFVLWIDAHRLEGEFYFVGR